MLESIKDYWFLISSIALPFVSYVVGKYVNKIKKSETEKDAIKGALFVLTQSVLLDRCERYRSQGWCSYEAKQALQNLYREYHNLGGNSFITAMVDSCMKLPDMQTNLDTPSDTQCDIM